tara:strand:+ start:5926 stop:6273 length:348 start_codon:yes stop_codon:yes gene_type:complete
MILEIFEPTLCCESGVCGPAPDKALLDLQHTLHLVKKVGFDVKRYAINQVPMVFVQNKIVSDFIQNEGLDQLPLILLDKKIIMAGKYPNLEELEQYIPALKGLDKEINIVGLFKE